MKKANIWLYAMLGISSSIVYGNLENTFPRSFIVGLFVIFWWESAKVLIKYAFEKDDKPVPNK